MVLDDHVLIVPARPLHEGHLLPRGRAALTKVRAARVDADVLPPERLGHLGVRAIVTDEHQLPAGLWGGEPKGAVLPRVWGRAHLPVEDARRLGDMKAHHPSVVVTVCPAAATRSASTVAAWPASAASREA